MSNESSGNSKNCFTFSDASKLYVPLDEKYMLIFTHIPFNETIYVSKSYDYVLYSNYFFDSYREFALLDSFWFLRLLNAIRQ